MASVCSVCKIPSEALVTVKGKKMCPSCYEAHKASLKAKDAKLAAKFADPDRKAVEQYLLTLWPSDQLPPHISRQLEQQSKVYRYTDILYALRYFYELEENEVPEEISVGIIPYVMKEAMEHKQRMASAAAANASFVATNDINTVIVHRRPSAHQFLGYSVEDL